jgi:ankyrin repeat protein
LDSSSWSLKVRQREIIQKIYVDGDSKLQDILVLLANKCGIEVDLSLDEEENTALHWAAANCQLLVVAALIEKGANILKTNI